jgi:hypothetical protein
MTQSLPIEARGKGVRRKGLVGAVALCLLTSSAAYAEDQDPRAILKEMTVYVSGQAKLSARYDTDIEVITPELQKIQFTGSGELVVDRKAGLRAKRTGGYTDVELIFDGKMATLYSHDSNSFATVEAPGSIDDLVERLRNDFSIEVPGADLLLAGAYEKLTEDVVDAKYVGLGVIDGVECDHLAFRTDETDWQLWVEAGEHPAPRKYVITSKTVAQAPQYTLRIKELRTDVKADADAFTFKAPDGAKQVEIDGLGDIDEVPPGGAEEEDQP